MRHKRWYYIWLFAVALGLMLALTLSGSAQDETPAADPTAEPEPTADVMPPAEATGSLAVTIEVVASPVVTPAKEASTEVETEGAESTTALPRAIMAEGSKALELTVYNQNLGLVKEVRALELEEGENQVQYTNVASEIQPTSVHFVSLTDPEGTVVLEQNYEYDVVNSRRLLQKYVDKEITLNTKEGTVYTGTLLSGADDIILAAGGRIRIIKLAQIQEFSFPELPEGLITKPTLLWLLEASKAGEQDVRVTYLTGGINWRADFIAMLAADDKSLSLTGWVTVDNQSGATYEDAKLKLVAGDIHRAPQVEYMLMAAEQGVRRTGAVPQVEERAFFEYHIYEVKRPVTVRDRQAKQIEFVAAPDVAVEKVFVYDASPRPYVRYGSAITDPNYGLQSDKKVQVRIEFSNSEESGLGVPLPKGTIRVYKEDTDGGAELVGEDAIAHTAKDEDLSLYLGDAFDIVGERVQTGFRQLGDRSLEESYEITLRNHKTEDAVVRVIEHLFRAQDAEIIQSSEGYEMMGATTLRYEVNVQADSEASIRYTVRYRW